MITRIHIRGFKSLADVELELGPLNLLIGANASGKSNLLDVFRFLQGVGYGFTVPQILDGKPQTDGSIAWPGIRGGSANVAWRSGDGVISIDSSWCYQGQTIRQSVSIRPNTEPQFERSYDQQASGLMMKKLNDTLSKFQYFAPEPNVLRQYGSAIGATRMGDRGEDFAAIIREIEKDPKAKSAVLAWLREVVPSEIQDITTLSTPRNEPYFAIRESQAGERLMPADSLSDGTLRFAALVAAFFQPSMPDIARPRRN